MSYQNKCAAEKFGNLIGEFLEMENEEEDLAWSDSIRIRVKIDISKALLRGFMLKSGEAGGERWITIRYERLLDFCFKCGCIGHGAKECKTDQKDGGSNKNNFEFDAWLKFQGYFRGTRKQTPPANEKSPDLNSSRHPENSEDIVHNTVYIPDLADEGGAVDFNLEKDSEGEQKNEQVLSNDSVFEMAMEEDGIQIIESSRLKEVNNVSGTLSQSEGSSGGFVVSTRKKLNWKRRARMGHINESSIQDQMSKKRKSSSEPEEGKKMIRLEGVSLVDRDVSDDTLAVAGKQPCLEL